jgi:two-component system, OmpR family, copper resistance phosphate regulon response regulator CusR
VLPASKGGAEVRRLFNSKNPLRILLVEDEPKTAAYARKGLAEHGFVVDVAGNGADGRHLALSSDYDLVVLDVMLPGVDGWTVLRDLREKKQTPVLFLTARDDVADKVKGLELGADDYLVKPFAFSELLARVRSLLRRGGKAPAERLTVGDLEIDPRRRRVSRGDRKIDLTAKEFALLDCLVRNCGEVMSRTLIAERVWDMNFDSDTNVVDVAMRRLRAKVDDPFEVKLIRTVRGVGYAIEEPQA